MNNAVAVRMAVLPSYIDLQHLCDRYGFKNATVILARLHNGAVPQQEISDCNDSNVPIIATFTALNIPGATAVSAIRAEQALYPASMIKVPLAVAVADALARGTLSEDLLVVEPAQLTVNDAPSPLVLGYSAAPRELLDLMLRLSDNIATNMLLDAVGREAGTAALARYGLPGTRLARYLSGALPRLRDQWNLGENAHPPNDAAHLFALLAARVIPEADFLLDILARQHWNGKLAAGLRTGDRFAHKTGDTSDVSHDGGLLTTVEGVDYLIVLYTAEPSNAATDARFAAWMRELRLHL